MEKLIALVLSLALVLTCVGFAFAATDGSITLTKNFNGQTYKLYQIFSAETLASRTDESTDGISYKLMSGKTDLKATVNGSEVDGAQWFDIDSAGNITAKSGINLGTDAFRAWVEAYGVKNSADKTATKDNDDIKWENLAEGYYYITTTTGSLVTVDSIKPNVSVEDKNTIPTVDKKITGASNISDEGKKALAQIGTDVTYTAEVVIGKGSKNVVFHDKMDDGLTFKGNSEVTVTGITAEQYTIKATPDSGDTLTISFVDGLAEGTKITIVYKATINANALTKLENHAKVSYGDNNTTTQESKTETYNAEIAVIKYDGAKTAENAKYLAGAGFKLRNSEGKFYKLTTTTTGEGDDAVTTYVASWVDEADADEHVSVAETGKVPAFTGLAAGTYTLVESTVPAGYNKAADVSVEIKAGDYSAGNLSQTKEIENHTGTELPSTGGIGTTLFYIIGGLLVVGAAVVLVARRKAD